MILFMLCISTQIFAETVRLRTDIDLVVSGTTASGANNIALNVEASSGDATADSAPVTLYIPIENAITQTYLYYFNATAGFPTSLFNTSVATDVVNIPLRIVSTSTDMYLYAAVKDTTDSNKFKVIKQYSTKPFIQNQTVDVAFPLAPNNICKLLINECVYLTENSASATEKNFLVYFFLSSAPSYGVNQDVDISAAPFNNGIYFNIFMSNRIYNDDDLRITINSGKPGDKRVIINYSSTATLSSNYAKAVKVYKHTSDPSASNMPIGFTGYSGSLLAQDFDYVQDSTITVNGLSNSEEVILSVVFLDKFNFVTTLSQEVKATPLEIQELLKKNACFLLTAGFGEDHFIIDYFRNFRDQILASTYLGRSFIHVYYELAPKYALMIYQHEGIRLLVRGFAYTLYFIFNFYYIFVATFIGIFIYFIYGKRSKI